MALVLVVVQLGAESDPTAALAALPAARRVLVRPPALASLPVPAGVELALDPEYERAALAARLARAPADLVVVLLDDERPSPELAAALDAVARAGARGCYAAARRVRCLGRELAAEPTAIAWGDAAASAPPVGLAGAVETEPTTVSGMIERLEAVAMRERPEVAVGLGDFVGRPLAALTRRLWRRRRDGVPGLVFSILETYGEVLSAAHAWEREEVAYRRAQRSTGVPPGFHVWRTPAGWLTLRDGTDATLREALLDATPDAVRGEPLPGGRGGVWVLALNPHERAVLRWYRRGGAIRRFVRDRYFGWSPRPLVEVALTEEARRRGVAAAEVLGARVDRLRGGYYRGAIVTREVPNAITLAVALGRHRDGPERDAMLAAVGRAVRELHDRGVHHRDLNATNILVCGGQRSWTVHFIDFDRAAVRPVLAPRVRRRALRRLERSLAKLARTGMPLAASDTTVLRRAYDGAADPR